MVGPAGQQTQRVPRQRRTVHRLHRDRRGRGGLGDSLDVGGIHLPEAPGPDGVRAGRGSRSPGNDVPRRGRSSSRASGERGLPQLRSTRIARVRRRRSHAGWHGGSGDGPELESVSHLHRLASGSSARPAISAGTLRTHGPMSQVITGMPAPDSTLSRLPAARRCKVGSASLASRPALTDTR